MARVSYIEEKDHPELADLIGKVRAGRRGTLINVYKLLLHSPPLAACWLDLISAARYKTELDGRLREIASSSASATSTKRPMWSSSTCRSSPRRRG